MATPTVTEQRLRNGQILLPPPSYQEVVIRPSLLPYNSNRNCQPQRSGEDSEPGRNAEERYFQRRRQRCQNPTISELVGRFRTLKCDCSCNRKTCRVFSVALILTEVISLIGITAIVFCFCTANDQSSNDCHAGRCTLIGAAIAFPGAIFGCIGSMKAAKKFFVISSAIHVILTAVGIPFFWVSAATESKQKNTIETYPGLFAMMLLLLVFCTLSAIASSCISCLQHLGDDNGCIFCPADDNLDEEALVEAEASEPSPHAVYFQARAPVGMSQVHVLLAPVSLREEEQSNDPTAYATLLF